MKKISPLPESKNEFWEDAEKSISQRVPMPICKSHKKWKDHVGYIDNKDGTASCKFCQWGFILPGYMRILDGKVYDLRDK